MTPNLTRSRINTRIDAGGDGAWWLTHAAFVLGVGLVIARLTTVTVVREAWDAVPGGTFTPRGAGPGSALVFDLLAALTAILVLARRAIDDRFRLTFRWSHVPLFALGLWAALSTAWSADRFAAAVTAADLLGGAVLLWSMSQVVRSWARFRIVAAVALGLLLVLFVRSVMYRYMDAPADAAYWNEHKAEVLRDHGWTPGSFAAIQFERKVLGGDQAGFFDSPNTLAAVTVLLLAASIGLGIQRVSDGDDWPWLALSILATIAAVWLLFVARSKTSVATPVLGLLLVIGAVGLRPLLRQRARAAYFAGVFAVALALLAVIGHGLYHGGLFPGHFSNSLDFRWKYWTASVGVFREHPLLGVGWSNFGQHYLAHRRPEAAEEIKDPHNFLVRYFVELGLIGGTLLVAWLLRLAWELTRPDVAPRVAEANRSLTFRTVLLVCLLGSAMSMLAGTDVSQPVITLLVVLTTPVLYLMAMLLGGVAGSMRSAQVPDVDDRPAPWVQLCLLVGLGLFLLHNLIDFAWSEPGPMTLFMALIGSGLGVAPAAEAKRAMPRIAAFAAVGVSVLAWLILAVAFVGPVVVAEADAAEANELVRTAPVGQPSVAGAHFRRATDDLAAAVELVPYNADYQVRQARALLGLGDVAAASRSLRAAQQTDPFLIDAYLLDANVVLAGPTPDASRVRGDFDAILRLNPNDVALHVQYARALDRFGTPDDARVQYAAALAANAALPADEPKRLAPADVAALQARVDRRP